MPVKFDTTVLLYVVFILGGTISLILGALSWARTTALFLPLPTWVPVITTLLSPLAILTLLSMRLFPRARPGSNTPQNRTPWGALPALFDQIYTIISTIVATVALAYLFPENILSCNLDQQWQAFFQNKDSHAIRTIQDRFHCCGLRSIHDRAWPFKDRNHGDNACELQLGYQQSCLVPWREQQRGSSWMVFAAILFVFAARIALVRLSGHHRRGWMGSQSAINGRAEYPQISDSGVREEEGENDEEANGEARRTLLPQSNTQHNNEWESD